MADVRVRSARAAEAATLSEIAERPKTHRGCDAAFSRRSVRLFRSASNRFGWVVSYGLSKMCRLSGMCRMSQMCGLHGWQYGHARGQPKRARHLSGDGDLGRGHSVWLDPRLAVAVAETRAVTSWNETDERVRNRGRPAPVLSSGRAADPPVTCSWWQRRDAVVRELHDVETGRAAIVGGSVVDRASGRVEAWW